MQGQGNGMTGTLPREMSSSVFSNHLRGRVGQPPAEPSPRAAGQSPSPDPAALLITLLSAAPVDLCRVSEEMRAHPDLQALVLKLACYLSFSPDTSGTTVEESVVVVGTDRLRVLVYLWSMLRQWRAANNLCDPKQSRSGAAEPSTWFSQARSSLQNEIADLASFLESLGLDSAAPPRRQPPLTPFGPQEAESFELTDMLVRDVVSLIPLVEPAFRKQQNSSVAGRMARAGKEAE